MVRNPDAYDGETFARTVVEEAIQEEDLRREVGELWRSLCGLGEASYKALMEHCELWASRGVRPKDTPIGRAIPLLRAGESKSEAAKRLAPSFNLSPSTIRTQISRILPSPSPQPPSSPSRPLYQEARYFLNITTFKKGHFEVELTGSGWEVRMEGAVMRMEDEDIKDLRDFLVRLLGVGR